MNRRTFLVKGAVAVGIIASEGCLQTYSLIRPVSARAADNLTSQDYWRWCNKCEGLFFAGNSSQGVCPTGGEHNSKGSYNYSLVANTTDAPGQHDWRWCYKCQGLFFDGNLSAGVCPAGGNHRSRGSYDYSIVQNNTKHAGQHNWRWCHKCQGLFFGGNPSPGACPAGDTHENSGSGNYSLLWIANHPRIISATFEYRNEQQPDRITIAWDGGQIYDAYQVRWEQYGRNKRAPELGGTYETTRKRRGGTVSLFNVADAKKYVFRVRGRMGSESFSAWSEPAEVYTPVPID